MTRKLLGQVWTPPEIAEEMVRLLASNLPKKPRYAILDPCSGPGTFAKALRSGLRKEFDLTMYEIDKNLVAQSKEEERQLGSTTKVNSGNFLTANFQGKPFDACIINPPYVRHELLTKEEKLEYSNEILRLADFKVPQRSNLYIYFIFKSLAILKPGGIMIAIIYDTLGTTQYGKIAWEYLRSRTEILESRTISAPFGKVMVDAQILVIRKNQPQPVIKRSTRSRATEGMVRLGDLVTCKRGTAYSPRVENLVKLIGRPSESGVIVRSASQKSVLAVATHELRVPVSKDRSLWESDGVGIIFNYYLREGPRFFMVTGDQRVSDNFICISSSTIPMEATWLILNSTKYRDRIFESAGAQGSGLRKLQVYSFRDVMVPDWNQALPQEIKAISVLAKKLLSQNTSLLIAQRAIDDLLGEMEKNETTFTKAL